MQRNTDGMLCNDGTLWQDLVDECPKLVGTTERFGTIVPMTLSEFLVALAPAAEKERQTLVKELHFRKICKIPRKKTTKTTTKTGRQAQNQQKKPATAMKKPSQKTMK